MFWIGQVNYPTLLVPGQVDFSNIYTALILNINFSDMQTKRHEQFFSISSKINLCHCLC